MYYKVSKKESLKSYVADIFKYRRTFFSFVKRDIILRYKDTFFGVVWAILKPLITVLMFSVIFFRIAVFYKKDLQPFYVLYMFSALIVWNMFSGFITQAIGQLLVGKELAKKIYFPHIYSAFSSIGSNLLDFLIAYICLTIYAVCVYPDISWPLLIGAFPVVFFTVVFQTTGIILFLGALNTRYRDISYIIPFFLQLGLLVSPVIFPVDQTIAKEHFFIYSFIPSLAPIYLLKAVFGYHNNYSLWMNVAPSLLTGFFMFIVGFFTFKKNSTILTEL